MDSPLERRIKTYAFTHPNCDLDTAAYKVLRDITSEITQNRKTEGLYDSLFGGEMEYGERKEAERQQTV